ncbi:MAG TPA: NrfD/PsrC family molybdoenzyme membrane anchor subunit [Myxococcales bacterium]
MSGEPSRVGVEEVVLATHRRPGPGFWALLLACAATAAFGGWCYSRIVVHGMGLSGLNRPVGWGSFITNFVFWVGIAHSGTLISAILFLFRARFRTAVYRVAEAMTVFAVLTAGLFPVLHLGRPWFAYWLFPYPNQRMLWVNFRSPLMWDVFAVSTYLIVSSVFLLVGIAPDAAALRDRARGWRRRFYGLFAFGWRGTGEQWRHYGRAYLFFAAFATPLVVSVHSVVSWDFAVSLLPGWHSTLFPPYFVAGAILSGVAMVVTLLVPLRRAFHLEPVIQVHHLDMLSRLVLLTSLIVSYSYATEFVLALTGEPGAERSTLLYRASGAYAPLFWIMLTANSAAPLLFFFRRVRTTVPALFAICLGVNVGMWLERFVIIASSLSHDRDPFTWHTYLPTWIEWGITAGAFGWFFFWFLLFVKLLPAVSIAELKEDAAHREEPEVAHAA